MGSFNSLSGLAQSSQSPYGGSNQWMPYASMGYNYNSSTGQAGPSTLPNYSMLDSSYSDYYPASANTPGSNMTLPGGYYASSTQDPALTNQLDQYLQSQIGQGIPSYNLSAYLPSSGQSTSPGQLTAPLTSLLQQLQSYYSGGASSVPGSSSLTNLATTGNPVNQTPAWQAMVAQEEGPGGPIAQNEANLAEQFASQGSMGSSEYANALSNYLSNTSLGQTAQLTSATTQAQQAANQNMLSANSLIQQGSGSLGQYLQGLDQNSINTLYSAYMQALPQNNPMNQEVYGASETYPEIYSGKQSSALGAISGGIGGGLGALVGLLGL